MTARSAIRTLSENARLLAMLNVAMADAAIAVWRGKFDYMFWRPITAIQLGGSDGNPATIYGGIHFRTADVDARPFGEAVGNYVIVNAFRPLNGNKTGQLGK